MDKHVYIVHRWEGTPKDDWYPWLKKQLEEKGYLVTIPTMPNTDEPVISEWVSHLASVIKNLDENTIFVGHSIGCQTILRYLESLDSEVIADKGILVAPFMNLENLEGPEVEAIAEPWLIQPINWEKVKSHAGKWIAFFDNDDPWVPLTDADIFKDKLGAETHVLEKRKHFTDTKLPELLKYF